MPSQEAESGANAMHRRTKKDASEGGVTAGHEKKTRERQTRSTGGGTSTACGELENVFPNGQNYEFAASGGGTCGHQSTRLQKPGTPGSDQRRNS